METLYQVVSNTKFSLKVEKVTKETATGAFYTLAQLKEEFLDNDYLQEQYATNPPFIKIDMIVEHVCRFFNDNPTAKSCPNMVDVSLNICGVNGMLHRHGIKYVSQYNAFYRYKAPSVKPVTDVSVFHTSMICSAIKLLNSKFNMSITFNNTNKLKLKDYHKNLIQLFETHKLTFDEVYQSMQDQRPGCTNQQLRAQLHTWWFQ